MGRFKGQTPSKRSKMARLLSLLAFLAAVVCMAMAQGNTASTSTTVIPTPSSTMAPKTPTPSMSPTPTPTPPPISGLPANKTYELMDKAENKSGNVCLRMLVGIALNFTYTMKNGKMNNTVLNFSDSTVSDGYCNSTDKPSAMLKLMYMPPGESHNYTVTFYFIGEYTRGNQHWSFNNLTVGFVYNETDFPNFVGPALPDDSETFTYTNDSLFDETTPLQIELTRSYRCNSTQTIDGFKAITPNNTLNVTLKVIALRVQAFRFRNATSGEFDNARVCSLDNPNPGNQIVPIAVGAGLAVLVVIVLIAYIVGKLRNRKKSSYEPLS